MLGSSIHALRHELAMIGIWCMATTISSYAVHCRTETLHSRSFDRMYERHVRVEYALRCGRISAVGHRRSCPFQCSYFGACKHTRQKE
jgi:hypothetical protein